MSSGAGQDVWISMHDEVYDIRMLKRKKVKEGQRFVYCRVYDRDDVPFSRHPNNDEADLTRGENILASFLEKT